MPSLIFIVSLVNGITYFQPSEREGFHHIQLLKLMLLLHHGQSYLRDQSDHPCWLSIFLMQTQTRLEPTLKKGYDFIIDSFTSN